MPLVERPQIMMPIGAGILSVQFQGDELFLWALVDTEKVKISHDFLIFGTGVNMNDSIRNGNRFIGTVQQFGGKLVWHIFQIM